MTSVKEHSGVRAGVLLAYAGFVLAGISAGVGGVALPAQIADYGVSRAAIGLTFFTFSAGFMLAAGATGHLTRRLGIRMCLILGGVVAVISALATAARPPFWLFVLLAVPSGFGNGVLESVLNVYLSGLPRATTLLNRLHAFFGVGALIGPVLAARILLNWSWTAIWVVLAVANLVLVLGFVAFRPDGTRSMPPRPAGAAAQGKGLLGSTLRQPAVLLGAVMLATYVGLEASVGNWGYSYLVAGRGQEALVASNLISGYWLGMTAGRFVISPVAVRLGWTDARMGLACLLGVLASILVVWLVPGPVAAAAGLGLLGFFLGPIFPTLMAAAPALTDASRVPTAIGVLNGVSVVGGSALPWLAGVLLQGIAVWTLMPYAAALAVVQLVIWWWLAGRLRTTDEVTTSDGVTTARPSSGAPSP